MKRCFLICLLSTISRIVFAGPLMPAADTPDTGKVNKVILKDGSELIGRITELRADSLKFMTLSGVPISLAMNAVANILPLSGEMVSGEFRRVDPNRTRLLFGPTARALPSGQGYFGIYELFFPFLGVGAFDFVTLAGGVSLFPGAPEQLYYISPKITAVHLENVDIAIGGTYANVTGGSVEGVGIVYGVGTFGSRYSAVTAGLGYGYAEGEFSNSPVFMLGGELQVSNSVKFVSENWFPPKSDISLLSFGVRFFGDNLAADIAFFFPAGAKSEGIFLPWLGFAYNFGPK